MIPRWDMHLISEENKDLKVVVVSKDSGIEARACFMRAQMISYDDTLITTIIYKYVQVMDQT
jgi:hypothetical protein